MCAQTCENCTAWCAMLPLSPFSLLLALQVAYLKLALSLSLSVSVSSLGRSILIHRDFDEHVHLSFFSCKAFSWFFHVCLATLSVPDRRRFSRGFGLPRKRWPRLGGPPTTLVVSQTTLMALRDRRQLVKACPSAWKGWRPVTG